MSEIVVAYARPDLSAADRVISKLEGLGFQVRRDEAGKRRTARRAAVLRGRNAAEPTLVLWSRHYALARLRGMARRRSATLTARLDASPLSFLMKSPAIDLRAWRGRDDHRGWKALLAKARIAGGAPMAKPKAAAAKAASKPIVVKAEKAPKAAKPEKKGGAGAALFWLAAAAAAAAGSAAYFVTMH